MGRIDRLFDGSNAHLLDTGQHTADKSELIEALGGYLQGDIVRQYHHCDMYDDAEIVHVHGNGALDVRSLKTGDMWGWSENTCTVISRPTYRDNRLG